MTENENNFRQFGSHHTACGRVLPQHRTAALDDEAMEHPPEGFQPVKHVIQGAQAFAAARGLTDPHHGINYANVRTNRGLLTDLAHHYDHLPMDDPSAHKHFDAMRHEVADQHHFMTHKMGIQTHVVDHDPYKNVHELRHDVENNHQIKVMGTHVTGGHPYFSNDENDKFRAVHDVFGHLGTGRDFDRHGEEAAFQAHARMFSHHALPAMTSETRGQNGSLIVNGHFGPQRIATLPQRLWHPGLVHTASSGLESGNRFASEIDSDPDHPYAHESRDYTAPGGQQYKLLHGVVSRNTVSAHHRMGNGSYRGAGYINWMGGKPEHDGSNTDGGVIYKAHVSSPHQRRGLASAMLDFARDKNPDKDIRHSTALSDDGRAWSEHKATMIDDFRAEQDAQNRRAETHTRGYGKETDSYFGRDGEGDAQEKRLTYKDYLKRSQGPKEGEEDFNPAKATEYFKGAELGEKHVSDLDHANLDELTQQHAASPHPDHFYRGYQHGWEHTVPQERVAVLVSSLDDTLPVGMRVIAHVSGNSVNILHCPFCGSGAVIGRSDGTIECGYCTTVFTVQVQPAYNGFPQSVDGNAYPWPGAPDPGDVLAPQAPPGTNLAPGVNDPTAMGGDPMGGMPPQGPPDSSDPADGGGFGDDEESDDDDKPAFLKGKGGDDKKSDKKDDKKKGDNPFAKKKSSKTNMKCDDCGNDLTEDDLEDGGGCPANQINRHGDHGPHHPVPKTASYIGINGAELPVDEFLAHIAIQTAREPLKAAQKVREARQRGEL